MSRLPRTSSKDWGFESQFTTLCTENNDETCWLIKHAPTARKHLAIHKKKLDQVHQALTSALSKKRNKVLILTGPSGVGKSATVRALANDLNCSLEEWVNPIMTYEKGVYYETEISKFKNFLLYSSRYASLFEPPSPELRNSSNKIVLIEELPSIVTSKQEEFWDIIKTYSRQGLYPVVLILSDGAMKNMRIPTGYHNIPFNPVAPTLLNRALKHICHHEKLREDRIEDIVLQSDGDLRNAILSLQFNSRAENGKNPNKRRKVESRKASQPNGDTAKKSECESKDSRLLLFHALGKFLYAKREESSPLDCDDVILARRQLEFVPEVIADKCAMSSGWITEFLHHNYLQFRMSIDHTLLPSDMICDSDIMTSYFVTDNDNSWRQEFFAKSIVARSIVFSKDPGFIPKFTPLCRPVQRDISKTCSNNMIQCRDVFALRHLGASLSFLTDTLPFFKLLRYRPSNPEEYKLIQTMTFFNTNHKSGVGFTTNDDGEVDPDEKQDKQLGHKTKKDRDLALSVELEQEIEEFSD